MAMVWALMVLAATPADVLLERGSVELEAWS